VAGIVIDSIRKSFGAVVALSDISLEVADGEFVALLGPSGCGKTTLLRIVAGLETQTSGRVVIGGRDVSDLPPRRRGLAMVFQNYAVFPHMTVAENIAFGLRMQRADASRIDRQVRRAAELLHIERYLDRYPARLSGGQRQRVAVARALAVEPAVLLMDEPLSNLDALLRLEMRSELKSVLAEAGTTTIYVTHDQTEAMGLADRIALMHGGVIEQIDAPQALYERPRTRFVGAFIGNPPMNFVGMEADGAEARLDGYAVPASVRPGGVLAGIRAEDLHPVDGGEGLPFDVAVAEPLGSHTLVTGRIGADPVRVVLRPDLRPPPGTRMFLRPDPERIAWIDPETGRSLEARPA
jgi:multiple sugar transport system ATP-binding protein